MSAAYQDIVQTPSAFDRATETFAALKRHMRTAEAMQMTHGELESHVIEKTRTIARDVAGGSFDAAVESIGERSHDCQEAGRAARASERR